MSNPYREPSPPPPEPKVRRAPWPDRVWAWLGENPPPRWAVPVLMLLEAVLLWAGVRR